MRTQLSLLAGAALIATIGVAQAGEPMMLSENQMDQVSAGQDLVTFNNGVVTVNGIAVELPAGINIELIGNTLFLTTSGVTTTINDPTVILTVVAPAAK